MPKSDDTISETELVYALAGEAQPRSIRVHDNASNADILNHIVKAHDLEGPYQLFWEDEAEPLDDKDSVLTRLKTDFRQIQVAKPGFIEVTFSYNNRTATNGFRPNTTVRKLIEWAVSEEGLALLCDPSQFQVKLGGKILPPESHLGQVARGEKAITLTLVQNVKPQG